LEVHSSIDMLTGIKNRNTMNNRVDRIVAGKENLASPYAVIFADLNGLKRVNDEKGHSEGDNLLKSAAAILKGVFHDSDVYRAGGDEFMVIAEDIGEDEVNRRIEMLYEQSASVGDLHFAVGISFSSSREDILKAMRLADEGMYKDKKKFYEINPDAKYR
ncbi:MAG: GGDEF domain-containing protein, partial [Ruminococcus sp.]|nr:GGDEF domain-containing protein [Ruminococcus sp.]